ncbi:MAG: threonylcarbamoyl-AMP synthase [Planctomycetes bacterium]|nr:threonylcarbamoyl-AMP synthase [Planctomycetota bacterium]
MNTNVIKTNTRKGYAAAVKAAVQVLESGGLVGIPTETVYGLAASAEHPQAIARLRKIKDRAAQKKFTICIPLKSDVKRFSSSLPRNAEKLINHFWPGPLTLVLPGKAARGRASAAAADSGDPEATVGLRMPGLSLTRDVLLGADTTVVIPSANPLGAEPAKTAEEVVKYFDGLVELVLDAGVSPLGVCSTVVEVSGQGTLKVLRLGAIGPDDLRRAIVRTVLFVCTGNICRSPMAEGFAREVLAGRLGVEISGLETVGFRVVSAGTASLGGRPPSPEAVTVMREVGIDISANESRPLTLELVRDADDIFVMAPYHQDDVRAIDRDAAARTTLLSPEGQAIADPIGQSIEVYRRVRDQIRRTVAQRMEQL